MIGGEVEVRKIRIPVRKSGSWTVMVTERIK